MIKSDLVHVLYGAAYARPLDDTVEFERRKARLNTFRKESEKTVPRGMYGLGKDEERLVDGYEIEVTDRRLPLGGIFE